jgi:8-oxo-dGTP pyrophosphatase MutT (NUDIX family)
MIVKTPVKPKEASTVILLRERPDCAKTGFEVLMVLRHPDSSFVPDSYVFPGGGLEESDCTEDMAALCSGIDRQKAKAMLDGTPAADKALGAWVSAIRETFEEVGLLLAYREDGTPLEFRSSEECDRFRVYRNHLTENRMTFFDILAKERLTLAADRLHYFSHWITPWFLPIRYDARFFVATAPHNQKTKPDGIELTKHVWISPRDLLEGARRRQYDMVEPTMVTVMEIANFSSIQEVISSTAGKRITARS